MEVVLKIQNLEKTLGGRKIIDNVSFETNAGEVFGFLGPNGAGKTTTIKMALGLLKKDGGVITICGADVDKQFEKALAPVGGIVENPETYPYLTGLQNLRQYARMRDGVTEFRIKEVVALMKLENRINDKVKKYSLGMRQRLGVAQAILHRPKLLVLDEPTNGLDPAGIRELRDTLKMLAHEEGCSVLVSSHLLSEMELMCDRVGIIHQGKMLGVKSIAELTGKDQNKQMRFNVSPVEQAKALLDGVTVTASDGESITVAVENDAMVGEITQKLVSNGIVLTGVAPVEKNLEDIFLEITGGGGQIA